jgi:filamentous hemagglutinin family protein
VTPCIPLRSLITGVLLALLLAWPLDAAHAQIVRDGSIGPPGGPLMGPNYKIDSTLGAIQGSNLFHSFSEFNLRTITAPEGSTIESATFTNSQPVHVTNVISRVTGGTPSSINGRIISEIPGATFYLLNPSGVLFGRNASLNLSGSFYVSTADFLRFTDGAKFFANLSQTSTLSSMPIAAFGFLGPTAAPMTVSQSRLGVPEGQTLALIGGDMEMTGDPFFTGFLGIPTLEAPRGQIMLASAASAGEVQLGLPGAGGAITLNGFTQLGQINLAQIARIETSSENGNGTITIRGGRLLVANRSFIFSDVLGNATGAPLGIDIALTGELIVSAGGRITSETDFNAAGSAGEVRIRAGSVEVTGFALVDNQVRASLIGSRLFPGTTGKGADVDLETGSLVVSNQGRIDTTTAGIGPPGAIRLRVGTLQVVTGGQISTSTEGSGAGGNLQITASGEAVLSGAGSGLSSGSTPTFTFGGPGGLGGNIGLQGATISVLDGATISATSTSTGNAGNIQITASDMFQAVNASVATEATRAFGGNITFEVGRMFLLQNSTVTTSVQSGAGNGGNITIDPQFVILQNSQIIAQAVAGNGGNITITTDVFLADYTSLVDASSQFGLSGTVTIQSPISNLSGALAPLTQAYLSAAALLRQPCAARAQSGRSSSFIQRGRDGLPAAPGSLIPSPPAPLPPAGAPGRTLAPAAPLLVISDGALSAGPPWEACRS